MVLSPELNSNVSRDRITIYLLMMLYKLALQFSFWKVLTVYSSFYTFDYSVARYINGVIYCGGVLFAIDFNDRKISSFFLLLMYAMQVVPITVVYSLTRLGDPICYNAICFVLLFCALATRRTRKELTLDRNNTISFLLIVAFVAACIYTIFVTFQENGEPSFAALDVFSVYALRKNNTFSVGKLASFLLSTVATVFLPILAAFFALRKKCIISAIAFGGIFLLYLYTGHKTYLFSIPLVIAGIFFSYRKKPLFDFFVFLLGGLSVLSLLACLFPGEKNVFFRSYSLLIRRTLFVPAEVKFYHFDYFSSHPKLLLYGVLPRKINPLIPVHYSSGLIYTYDIGRIYANAPNMSADTGFLIEGYDRFGYIGFVLTAIILIILLLQIDEFQKKAGYSTAFSFFLYPIYSLAENQIIGNLFFGSWMFLLLLICFYREPDVKVSQMCLRRSDIRIKWR